MIIRTLLILVVLFAIDFYVFQGIRVVSKTMQPTTIKWLFRIYWFVTVVCFGLITAGLFVDWHDWPKPLRTYGFAFIFVTYFSKLFLVLFLVIDDVFRLFRWVAQWFTGSSEQQVATVPAEKGIPRSTFLIKLGMLLGAIPFTALLYGMIKGKYDYQVRKIRFKHAKLPDPFKGFRIVQVSDIHTGSFMSTEPLERAVSMINELKPDVIFFTGDLVNDLHSEAFPHIKALSKLKAPHGVFSILGNHDYGDYYRWPDEASKKENLHKLIEIHKSLGWDILLDEHRHIEKDGERISVIGVQNWSAKMNFARYGNLEKALKGIEYSPVNILLSHDPSHWRAEVLDKVKQIDLTLSGHTHGFQFGVEIPGFKWSPVQYVYKEWADMYAENGQHLYVNRGLGFLGYPGRVGILPEITVFDLDKG